MGPQLCTFVSEILNCCKLCTYSVNHQEQSFLITIDLSSLINFDSTVGASKGLNTRGVIPIELRGKVMSPSLSAFVLALAPHQWSKMPNLSAPNKNCVNIVK